MIDALCLPGTALVPFAYTSVCLTLVKKYWGEGGWSGPEHLEMWLIKNTWPTPSLLHKNDWPTPKARLEIPWPTPLLIHGCLVNNNNKTLFCVWQKLLIHSYNQYHNHRNQTFTEKTNVKNQTFLVSMDVIWVLTQIYSKTRGYWNCLSQSIWKFLQRQLIPTHYLPGMPRLILKENFYHFNGKHYLQSRMELQWAQRQQFWFLCQYFHDIYCVLL